MKIGAIIQARIAATRFPGKVVKTLPFSSDITVLQQVIRRIKRSSKTGDIIVATTINKEDKRIIELAKKENVKFFQGSINDVLERYYLAAKKNNLDIVVRVTSDCPCIDPDIVDLLIKEHLRVSADYTSNALNATYPHGLEAEVINFSALEKAYLGATEAFEREHVCPFIYRTKAKEFKVHSVKAPGKLTAPGIRITLDTEEDYILLCAVFDSLYYKDKNFNAYDIIELFKEKPWLELINKKVVRKKISYTLKEEIREAIKILDLQELRRTREILKRQADR